MMKPSEKQCSVYFHMILLRFSVEFGTLSLFYPENYHSKITVNSYKPRKAISLFWAFLQKKAFTCTNSTEL